MELEKSWHEPVIGSLSPDFGNTSVESEPVTGFWQLQNRSLSPVESEPVTGFLTASVSSSFVDESKIVN
jgi:hypothetical protein